MISREDAHRYLAEQKLPDWERRRREAIGALSPTLRSIGYRLMGYDAEGRGATHPYWRRSGPERRQAAQEMDARSATERITVFAALLPSIAPYVDAAWQLQKRFPYSVHGTRRAFRAPRDPGLTLARRLHWLTRLLWATQGYEKEVAWLAQWAGYLSWSAGELGVLFAAAIGAGDEAGNQVYDVLAATARGEHEVGVMGRHVSQALLSASRPEGWALMEQTLVAAQRQEGLRQVILETVDEAHPEAFRRMVRLIREQNLTRFSSVVRAVDVWLGLQWDAASRSAVRDVIEEIDVLLSDPDTAARAVSEGRGAARAYLALCTLGFSDVHEAIALSRPLLSRPSVEDRFAGAYFLAQTHLAEAHEALMPALVDDDLRVATAALQGIAIRSYAPTQTLAAGLFERLEEALPRFPARARQLEALLWPWITLKTSQREVANLLVRALEERPVQRLRPYLPRMDPGTRRQVVGVLQESKGQWDDGAREVMLDLLGDRSSNVREAAIRALAEMQLTAAEARQMEGYLHRKAGDLRRGVIGLLLGQDDEGALSSASRLLAAGRTLKRQAGLEILRQMVEADRANRRCLALAREYEGEQEAFPPAERALLDVILERERETPTLEDGLGLFDPAERTPPGAPVRQRRWLRGNPFVSRAAARCIQELDDLIHEHRETRISVPGPGDREDLLGNLRYLFPIAHNGMGGNRLKEMAKAFPLHDLWLGWWRERPAPLRDDDGFELLRALAPFMLTGFAYSIGNMLRPPPWIVRVRKEMFLDVDGMQLRYRILAGGVLAWLHVVEPPEDPVDFLLDAVEHSLSLADPQETIFEGDRWGAMDWRHGAGWLGWLQLARLHCNLHPQAWAGSHHVRLWRLLRWLDEPGSDAPRFRPQVDEVMMAFRAGGATEADLLDQFLGPRPSPSLGWYGAASFGDLNRLSGQRSDARHSAFADDPRLQGLVDKCRRRIVDVAWFERVYRALGEARWQKLHRAAKYASGGGGHKRAQLFAEAMAGHVAQETLVARVEKKRHQDGVRALGLLPLPQGPARQQAILDRYLLVQQFLRGSHKFGSQRRASEKLAAKIALQNLARAAGFRDPLRLQWAMEARASEDLAEGPLSVTSGDLTLTLSVDGLGQPHLRVERKGRRLKSVPSRARKEPEVAALLERKKELKRQVSRARRSLEEAMIRGDVFTTDELQPLSRHPVLRPLLAQLIFTGEGQMGYLLHEGRALVGVQGEVNDLDGASLRITHPYDLLQSERWHEWQQECFRRERIQPFKQVFRELYVLTAAERSGGRRSQRYAGQQVNPRQALALLGSRGWVAHVEEGIRRPFHEEGVAAWLTVDGGYFTPADVEGLTLDAVTFTRRGGWQPLPLEEVPPRLFSEVMRDLDLVVSVAHVGGVDPEASASTVEMRASLLHETCALLALKNVRIEKHHALVAGTLNDYTVHLGSGSVHQQPGGALCIIPVHSQHRGRLFLPFADDVPKQPK